MPEEFGRYELHDLLGRGGMGEVYRAFDRDRDRTVALKLLPKHLATDESFKTRFRRESRMAARLNEPHIIPIHDFGEIDGTLFIDMRLVEGSDLGSVLTGRGRLPIATAVSVVSQVAAALDAAHASGLVHRDVKPSNVLLTGMTEEEDANPFAYLVDFGIARSSTQEGTALTATTGTIGTVAYMSPERIAGEHGDLRTDIYALACVLYETLTGHKPFDGELFAIMYAHVNTPPPAVSALVPDAPAGLDLVVRKGMAKDPADRYASAGALAMAARDALRAARRPLAQPIASPPAPPRWVTPSPAAFPSPSQPFSAPPPPLQPHPSGPFPQPHPSGPPPIAAQPRSGPPPGRQPPGALPPPRGWTTPPPHSGPVGLPGPPGRGPTRSNARRNSIFATVGVVVVAAVVLALVLGLHKSGSPTAGPTTTSTGPRTSPVTTVTSGTVPSLDPGPAGSTVTWAHFASFSRLAGIRNGDTARAFDGASCTVQGPQTNDPAGIVDQVKCTYASSPVVAYIARFSSASVVQKYLNRLTDTSAYSVAPWSLGGRARGLTYSSPKNAKGLDITSTVCALPAYLVQFFVADHTKLTMKSLHDDYWDSAIFPDVVPPVCDTGYRGPATGSTASLGALADKPPVAIDSAGLTAFLERANPGLKATSVSTPAGVEVLVLGQQGKVSFWTFDNSSDAITRAGASTYPYEPKALGPPQAAGRGTVLAGMVHATFIVSGVFSGDGSGNAVAYTPGSAGWGAIKAAKNGNLIPSGTGVGVSGLGLSQAFGFANGQLETADCSTTLPISACGGNNRVLKFWAWHGSHFTLSSTAGRSR